jgi:hypothetical protein
MDDSITYSQMHRMNRWAGTHAQMFFPAIPSADLLQSVRWQCFLMYLPLGDPNDQGEIAHWYRPLLSFAQDKILITEASGGGPCGTVLDGPHRP